MIISAIHMTIKITGHHELFDVKIQWRILVKNMMLTLVKPINLNNQFRGNTGTEDHLSGTRACN